MEGYPPHRIRKTRVGPPNAGTDYFIYDEGGRLLGVYDATGATREEFVWFDGWRPVASIRPTICINYEIYRITSDQVGAPLTVRDDNGVTVWEWDQREPFGHQLPNEDPDSNSVYFHLNLRFPGQWLDPETGLYHNGARDYSPKAGRYIQSDPLGLKAGWNTYAYVGSNPANFIDPDGLVQKNPDGSYRFEPLGSPETFSSLGKGSVTWQNGTIFTDKGNRVAVMKYLSGNTDYMQNCHGFALDLPFWINDPAAIYKDEYREGENGNISVYYDNNGYISHSGINAGIMSTGKLGAWGPYSLPEIVVRSAYGDRKRFERNSP